MLDNHCYTINAFNATLKMLLNLSVKASTKEKMAETSVISRDKMLKIKVLAEIFAFRRLLGLIIEVSFSICFSHYFMLLSLFCHVWYLGRLLQDFV